MSFTTFKNKPVSSKVVLFEFGTSVSHFFYLGEESGIWRYQWLVSKEVDFSFEIGAFCYGSFENGGHDTLTNNASEIKTMALIVNGEIYTKVTSLANLRATNKSFWWDDGADGVLHIHFDAFAPPWIFSSIKIGMAVSEANKAGVYDGKPFGSRLAGLSSLSISVDPLYYKILGYNSLSAEFHNADGELDNLSALDIFGQLAEVRYGEEGANYSDFEFLNSGIIQEFALDALKFSLDTTDKRKWFTKGVPVSFFDATTYPNIDPKNVGKPIPLAYGYCDNVPVVCTNELEATPASYAFKLADATYHGIKAIDAVRVNVLAVTPASTTPATATFTLSTVDYKPGQTVTADIRGYESGGVLLENALDVIKDLLEHYADIAYTIDTYDTAEWVAAAALAPTIQLFIDQNQAIESAVEQICVSLNGIMFSKSNGKFTFRYLHRAKSIKEPITREEMSEEPVIRYASDNFLSSLILGYDRDYDKNECLMYLDDSLEAEFRSLYGMTYRYEAETLLNSLTDVQALAANLLATYAKVPQWTTIKLSNISHIQLELLDDVTVNLDRASKPRFGSVDMRVYGISKDVIAGVMDLTLRRID